MQYNAVNSLNRYQSHFGTRVNEELWCDSGLGTSEDSLPADFYFPPYNLTESKSHTEFFRTRILHK